MSVMKTWVHLVLFVIMILIGLVLLVPTINMLEKMPIIVVAIFGVGISFLVTFGGLGLLGSISDIRKRFKS